MAEIRSISIKKTFAMNYKYQKMLVTAEAQADLAEGEDAGEAFKVLRQKVHAEAFEELTEGMPILKEFGDGLRDLERGA